MLIRRVPKWSNRRNAAGEYVGRGGQQVCPRCGAFMKGERLDYIPNGKGRPVCNECWRAHMHQLEVLAVTMPEVYQADYLREKARCVGNSVSLGGYMAPAPEFANASARV